MNETNHPLLTLLTEMPGLSAREIAEMLGTSLNNACSRLAVLHRLGAVERTTGVGPILGGKKAYLYRAVKGFARPAPPPRKKTRRSAKMTSMEARLAHLERWKELVVAQHPELAASNSLLEARQIAADQMAENPTDAGLILSGQRDDSPLVRAVATALERAES